MMARTRAPSFQEIAMKHLVVSGLALAFSLAAFGVAWSSPGGDEVGGKVSRLAADVSDATVHLAAIESRITRIEDALAGLRDRSPASIAPRPIDPDVEEKGTMAARLDKLEGAVAQLADSMRPGATPKAPRDTAPSARDPAVAKAIDAWVETARNASMAEQDRLVALRSLRGKQLPDGTDARLPVVEDMVRLAETSNDAATRADVWRQLSHVTHRSMLAPLLAALQNDAAPNVREEAAETLADFLPDDNVRRALLHAAENDQSPKVKSQAWDSLGARGR
jgi:hypothetical protein